MVSQLIANLVHNAVYHWPDGMALVKVIALYPGAEIALSDAAAGPQIDTVLPDDHRTGKSDQGNWA